MWADLLVTNTSEVLTCRGPAPRCGPAQNEVGAIRHGAVASFEGRIVFVGTTSEASASVRLTETATVIDGAGCTLVPGFVDAHTHAVFAGDRRHELRQRLAGATYAEIADRGGGILSTVDATRAATEEDLQQQTGVRLGEMLRCGTTTCEVKSGYALTTEGETKMLRVTKGLERKQPVGLVSTFLGAHEIPIEYRGRRREYVRLVIDEMLPMVIREQLAEWCDVFCEDGVFTVDEARNILQAARRGGLKLRIHADELGSSGGARLAAELQMRSADHLVFVTRDDARTLAAASVCATLLPSAAFYLKLGRFAPARMLIHEDVAVALATDVNPGGGFSPSMPFVLALACFGMGLTFEEALVGATLNGAWSIDRHEQTGSLEPGKQMDAVIVRGDAIELVRMGVPALDRVIVRGLVVDVAAASDV
jgi:imidazolonepropionase